MTWPSSSPAPTARWERSSRCPCASTRCRPRHGHRDGRGTDAAAAADLDTEIVEDDEALWQSQRDGQRSAAGTVVKVSALQTQLASVLAVAERLGAAVVGRAGLGLSWVALEDRDDDEAVAGVHKLRRAVSPAPCPVLDAPAAVRERIEVWDTAVDPGALALMRRVKERFDPGGVCNPGVFLPGV